MRLPKSLLTEALQGLPTGSASADRDTRIADLVRRGLEHERAVAVEQWPPRASQEERVAAAARGTETIKVTYRLSRHHARAIEKRVLGLKRAYGVSVSHEAVVSQLLSTFFGVTAREVEYWDRKSAEIDDEREAAQRAAERKAAAARRTDATRKSSQRRRRRL